MLTNAEILRFINDDKGSKRKAIATVGQRYYEGDHDIKNYKLYYYNADNELVEDTSRSNIKISHPFFTEMVDQEVQYMLSGKEGYIRSDNPELQVHLNDYFNDNEDFTSELYEVLTGAVSKGFEYMYAYKNKEDKLAFQCADSLGVVEVRAKDTQDNCDYVIYWYNDTNKKDNKTVKRIQVWNDKETTFFVQVNEGRLTLDPIQKINPRPHILYKKDETDALYFDGFGFIPFFRLDNSQKQFSGLKPIKDLIDDYDLMSCGLSNNLQDASEYLVVVKGFQGSDVSELMQNIKTKKHIGVDGTNGGDVDFKTVDVPYEARKIKLELDEKNIYRFGMGFNSAQIGDGNITNIVIKSRYALLDLKCNKLEIRLRQFLRKILKIVLNEINDKGDTDFQMKDVYFEFQREVMTNAQDNATIEKTDVEKKKIQIEIYTGLADILDDETFLESICEILEIDYEDVKERIDKKKETDLNDLFKPPLEVTGDEQ
ncbi:MAG: phage portal protein [Clostridiaceae bacterium]